MRKYLCAAFAAALVLFTDVLSVRSQDYCTQPLNQGTVVDCALSRSPEVRRARLELRALEGRHVTAGTRLPAFPVLSFSADQRSPWGAPPTEEPSSTFNWYVTLSQEVEIGGQRGARLRETDAELETQARRTAVTQLEVSSQALSAYFDVIASRDLVHIAAEVGRVAAEFSRLARAREEESLVSAVDADVAKSEAVQLAQLRFDAERRYAAAQALFAGLLGFDPDQPPSVTGAIPVQVTVPREAAAGLKSLEARALILRGEVSAARVERAVLQGRLDLIRRLRIPNPTFSIFAQRDGFDERVLGGGISMPLPLPAPLGPSRAGEISETLARLDQASANLELIRRQVRIDSASRLPIDAIDRRARKEHAVTAGRPRWRDESHAPRGQEVRLIPDLTNIQVQIITSAPALSPLEIEQYVTVPVERAMSGIPGVSEMRSISKYGISVVTVVFTDATNIYFARQMVSERMREAADAVPANYGKPEMGPISTGLGEIYQFVIRGRGYSLMQLEEVLHWYIGPQLRTVPGIVEVNSFGGEDRQYQVVVDPNRLQAAGLSIHDVVQALELTNANAGGGYIERNREQYLIGTNGLVTSLSDLKKVMLGATPQGVPITIANVGDVSFGPRLRRGAASIDGKGEVAVGVALMLMGENSRTVTQAVKNKIAALQASLPKGVVIEPFYDRSLLVNQTIHTVAKNLIEGALLVIGILLLLLGDLRAGLIVAATIPLSMMFAIVMMNITHTSGNLMSLGAIDFGLIVDGAVIIVENSVRRLGELRRHKGKALLPAERVSVIRDAAVEVRSASVYGELIIAIVYMPILALRGMEGKLFHPMALTVLFALAGAFIFSLTLVSVLASYLLVPRETADESWLMRRAYLAYRPVLEQALVHRWTAIWAGVVVFAAAIAIFPRLGAEFVPQLDEGDLLLEVRRLPGISLTESIATDRRIQRALLTIPEVAHAVSKTGAPEIATDPMGVEQTDIYVQLKPRDKWTQGLTRGGLAGEIHDVVTAAVPEAAVAVSQPIQMRTNELVAGARSDVAVQIYGPDLETLQRLAQSVGELIGGITGVADVRVEQGEGLSYLRIAPDRAKLARYGFTVDDLNTPTETIAVGRKAGVVFESDRRFDLVVRIAPSFEKDIDGIKSLPLKSSTGQMVPLGDVASVTIGTGPALINRSELSRRRTVEFNVRGRDLLSTVRQAQSAVGRAVKLPTGYRNEWGGQFENFISARRRLMVVVPIALALILFMLWMAFNDLRSAALIFLNVPLAAAGGIFALFLRGLPFSISAGIGFIALFGVAVLNGLVLVSFCRQRETDGASPAAAIREAAEIRLRPVLMTALVASLGFIPMALSTSPGSEVQRPLATVVIGGLVTATALTLILFPAVYTTVYGRGTTIDLHNKNGGK